MDAGGAGGQPWKETGGGEKDVGPSGPAATQQVANISPMGRKRYDGIGKTLPGRE